MNAFSSYYNLPGFNGSNKPTFEKLNQTGGTSLPGVDSTSPNLSDWEAEEAMDIEWAHAIAPLANIILFEATSSNDSDLFTAVKTAAGTAGVVVVSMGAGAVQRLRASSRATIRTTSPRRRTIRG